MTQTNKEGSATLATERAEQLLDQVGEQIGRLAGKATLRVQQAAQAYREEAGRPAQPTSASAHLAAGTTATQNAQAKQPSMERAEMLVGQLGQYVDHWTQVNSLHMKRTMARLQEDAEDMWVEAEEMRHKWQGKHEYVSDDMHSPVS